MVESKEGELPVALTYMNKMHSLHEEFQKSIDANLEPEIRTIADNQYQQIKVFSKEVMTEATQVKEQLDALKEKIQANHNTSSDKSFLKQKLSVYENCLPDLDLAKLKEQLDLDESICKASKEEAGESMQHVKETYLKFMKKCQDEFMELNLNLQQRMFGGGANRDHPFDGRCFKMLNVFDNGRGVENRWVGFRSSDRCFRATYGEGDAVPIKFYKVDEQPNVYQLKQVWPNEVYWIGPSTSGTWIYGRYTNREADSMPVFFEERKGNNKGNWMGECWAMQNLYRSNNRWVSFTDDGSWMRATYSQHDAMTVKLVEVYGYND